MSDEFLFVSLALIAPSLTNPRKTFDQVKLQELAASIKASGVHQPILLRPLPASRVADTSTDPATGKPRKVRPTYELVCGERRFRASGMAPIDEIPALIRDLTDDQVREIQIVENLQRDDLSELEEAEGYEQLMQHSKLTADQVGEKIGKSRSYVYARLKLLNLCNEARNALRDGTVDASRALLVARIPDQKLQIKAMKEIVAGHGYYSSNGRDPMTYREAAEHVQENYMLKLSDARFKITAVDLVKDAGSCKDCSKRTGADPDLFSDVKGADVCTDPPCFHRKEEAHAALLKKEAHAKGQTIIAGTEARDLHVGYGIHTRFKGYKRLDDKEDSPTGEPLRDIIGKVMESKGIKPTMLEHPTKKGQLVATLPNDVANTLLKAVLDQAKANKTEASAEVKALLKEKKEQEEARLQARFEREWPADLRAQIWARIEGGKVEAFTMDVHRYIAGQAAWSLSADDSRALCKLLGMGDVGAHHALIELTEKHPRPDLLHLLMIAQRDHKDGMELVAGTVFGSGVKEAFATVMAGAKARIWPKPEKAPAATAPAARPEVGAGGKATKKPAAAAKKLTAEEAKQGIAAAMQSVEGASAAPKGAVASPAKPVGGDAIHVGATIKLKPIGSIGEKFHGSKGRITAIEGETYIAEIEGHDRPTGLSVGQFDVISNGLSPQAAWPFPNDPAKGKSTTTVVEPITFTSLNVGQEVRITSDTGKLRTKHGKYAGKTGKVTGFDIGGKELDVKVGRETRCFEPGELEAVAA